MIMIIIIILIIIIIQTNYIDCLFCIARFLVSSLPLFLLMPPPTGYSSLSFVFGAMPQTLIEAAVPSTSSDARARSNRPWAMEGFGFGTGNT